MIEGYVNKLIENLPEKSKKIGEIDLVLDGGIFNGSYLVGALYFLKEMENRNYIKINRISGCSVGSIVALLYFIDGLELMPIFYEEINKDFKTNFSLSFIKNLKKYLGNKLNDDTFTKLNGRLFICYNNVDSREKIVKNIYDNIDDLIETIIKSCFVPFIIDNNMLYKNKYIDGINAHIFDKSLNKKILYMDLLGYDKFMYSINIKNEKTNFHRILSGLLDIHFFFIKGSNTSMCSFIDEWNIYNYFINKSKLLFEKIIVYIIYLIIYFKKYFSDELYENIIFKILKKILNEVFCILLETYCI
jgi:hypothetical protein